jgi:hypothetical protein
VCRHIVIPADRVLLEYSIDIPAPDVGNLANPCRDKSDLGVIVPVRRLAARLTHLLTQ